MKLLGRTTIPHSRSLCPVACDPQKSGMFSLKVSSDVLPWIRQVLSGTGDLVIPQPLWSARWSPWKPNSSLQISFGFEWFARSFYPAYWIYEDESVKTFKIQWRHYIHWKSERSTARMTGWDPGGPRYISSVGKRSSNCSFDFLIFGLNVREVEICDVEERW